MTTAAVVTLGSAQGECAEPLPLFIGQVPVHQNHLGSPRVGEVRINAVLTQHFVPTMFALDGGALLQPVEQPVTVVCVDDIVLAQRFW